MNPAELILTGGVFLGLAVPMSALRETHKEPADMGRFVVSQDCPNSNSNRCIFDTREEKFMGVDAETNK
jgi:hypothetical protein